MTDNSPSLSQDHQISGDEPEISGSRYLLAFSIDELLKKMRTRSRMAAVTEHVDRLVSIIGRVDPRITQAINVVKQFSRGDCDDSVLDRARIKALASKASTTAPWICLYDAVASLCDKDAARASRYCSDAIWFMFPGQDAYRFMDWQKMIVIKYFMEDVDSYDHP